MTSRLAIAEANDGTHNPLGVGLVGIIAFALLLLEWRRTMCWEPHKKYHIMSGDKDTNELWGSNPTPEQYQNGFPEYEGQGNNELGTERSEIESSRSNETVPESEEFVGHVGAIKTKTRPSKAKLNKVKRTARSRKCNVCLDVLCLEQESD